LIKVDKYDAICDIGLRFTNQDYLAIGDDERTFVVCDGVGGNGHGDVAAELVAKSMIESFSFDSTTTPEYALKKAELKLSVHKRSYPQTTKMATTLVCARILENTIQIFWCGDSRAYLFRKGAIIYSTTDHNWLNDALELGLMKKKPDCNHPLSHLLTRSVTGQEDPVEPDVNIIKQVETGDMLLLCSDGLLESWSGNGLKVIFRKYDEPLELVAKIKEACYEHSTDNFTAIVIRLVKSKAIHH
jgi:serine/threonine protein phosphatase PrpC